MREGQARGRGRGSANCGHDNLALNSRQLGGSDLIEYAEQTSCESQRVRR